MKIDERPAVLRTPFRINHGKVTLPAYCRPAHCGGDCLYCFSVSGLTKSTGANQDTLLAKSCNWDPVCQLATRMKWYGLSRGGIKYDILIKGDSFANKDPKYLKDFVKSIYDFYNGENSGTLDDAIALQAGAPDRCVTIKVETRPDQINKKICDMMFRFGVTTVEIGVQSLYDDVLSVNNRGHDVETVRRATTLLSRYGFEIGYQIMIGLYGSTPKRDRKMISELLWEDGFQPDVLKLYPCVLYDETVSQDKLRALYRSGKWAPVSDADYDRFLRQCLTKVPRYVHINQLQRIESERHKIVAGCASKIDRSAFHGISRCLWQRSPAQTGVDLEGDYSSFRLETVSQGSRGFCIEAVAEDDTVLGYGRMTVDKDSGAKIRDLRVLGNMICVGAGNPDRKGLQHIGIGKAMLRRMECLAAKHGQGIVKVHPGPGARAYFEKRGYRYDTHYPEECPEPKGWMLKKVSPRDSAGEPRVKKRDGEMRLQ